MKFDYDKVTQNKTVIHCDTEEKAINLIKWALENNLMYGWKAGDFLGYKYSNYGTNTCLSVSEYGAYSRKSFYEDEGYYTILSYDDVVIEDKEEIFQGDIMKISKEELRTYAIDSSDCTLKEAKEIRKLLVSIGEKIYDKSTFGKDTCFFKENAALYFSEREWIGVDSYQKTSGEYTVVSGKEFLRILRDTLDISYDDVVIKETFKKGDLVNGIRLNDDCKFNLHRYYGYCEQENKHLIHSNTNHNEPLQVWLVDKVEKVEMITKKQAKQEVSELFARKDKPTSQMIRNIIDRIE